MATPPGRGGISVVRLSGDGVPRLCEQLIGKLPKPRRVTLCDFRAHDGQVIDRGLVIYFAAPRSYTGEHALELHAHGSPLVIKMLLRRCIELGARMARPGEFSERAFLNGQMDLAQAEAVADLIESSTEAAARSAVNSLHGAFSVQINQLVDALTELRVTVEAAIDFPEEGIATELTADARIDARLRDLQTQLNDLCESATRGKLLRDGLTVALTGLPNVGKSSLLNALVQQPRAIVSAIAGTTRDVLEQWIEIDGVPIEIIDSAGIRDSTDEIEAEGVRRAQLAQQRADLILLVIDDAASNETTSNEIEPAKLLADITGGDTPVCVVRNKIDLSGRASGIANADATHGAVASVAISALTGAGINELRETIQQHANLREPDSSMFIARQRHIDALQRAAQCLESGRTQLANSAGELLAEELHACQLRLGEITGEIGSDELLGMIFASFCIGK